MVNVGEGLLAALLSGGESYLGTKQKQEMLQRERQKEEENNLIKMLSGGFNPYTPEVAPGQTAEDFMAGGSLKAPAMGTIPSDVIRLPREIGGSKLWRQAGSSPASYAGELSTPPKGKTWVNQPKLDTKTNKWYMEPTLVATGSERGDGLSFGQQISSEMNLRKEFTSHPVTKDFMDISNKYGRMVDAFNSIGKTNSRNAIDQAMINNFNKINDPGSVVRESEYARSPEGLSAMERMSAIADKVQKGGAGLTDNERKLFVDLAGNFYDSTASAYQAVREDYLNIASSYGFAPDKVVPPSYSKFALTKKETLSSPESISEGTKIEVNGKQQILKGGKWVDI